VYKALNVNNIETLSSQEAKEIIATVNGWIASAKKELKKQGRLTWLLPYAFVGKRKLKPFEP
jgi:hypothetical protein